MMRAFLLRNVGLVCRRVHAILFESLDVRFELGEPVRVVQRRTEYDGDGSEEHREHGAHY